ncbi:hypothetical protein RF11_04912 [Thelohanellus kitauei]|uniref:Uncharacterized protein n=1 Tax=Thelohanellus kitauei TaxID=669202 RepID=A0A0C2JAE5_THEKT|nr:hypothetical protein RF11_04912 [Thelohanellus kitauei]
MSEMIFKETTLPEKFFFNRKLWNEIRHHITYRIFLRTLFSKTGGLNFVKFYLQNFDRLYSEFLAKNDLREFFFRLTLQFARSKVQFIHLAENGVFCKILHFFSCNLKRFGFGKGKSISPVLKKIRSEELDRIIGISTHFCQILYFPVKNIDQSLKLESELQRTAVSFVKLCTDFDVMEPVTLRDTYYEHEIPQNKVSGVTCEFHYLFAPYAIILLKFDDIANMIISEFVKVFKNNMEIFTKNLSTKQAVDNLLTLSDIEKKPFSIFNSSQRLFFDFLTDCVVKRKLSHELKINDFRRSSVLDVDITSCHNFIIFGDEF